MILFHRTNVAAQIQAGGFRDSTACYMTDRLHTGIWFSNVPRDESEGADGDTLLRMNVPEELIADFEWIEEGKGYREWLIPAAIVNQFGPAVIVNEA
jgi:hypothetical protein